VQGIRALTTDLQRECMTAVKDPLITEPDWKAYTSLHEAGELGVRVFVLWKAGTTVDSARQLIARIGAVSRPYESTGDDLLISGGVKLFMEGSAAARTAWVYNDWYKNGTTLDTGNHGYPRLDPDTLRQLVKLFHDAGLHIGIHAIGDRAIDWVVDTYAAVLAANPVAGRRHSIIHAAIRLITRLA
jgi:predicted amidohydrolase YtcJ